LNRKEPKIKKILVPTDFSPFSEVAIDHAAVLAKAFKAEVVLIHVIESAAYSVTDTLIVVNHEAALRTTAEALMENLRKACSERGLPVTASVVSGAPYREIINKAEQEQVDLIAMGTHGRSGIERLLLGSVAEKVVRLATVPVLTIRSPEMSK
jgi:nucleotide-binding universal stress UspA family protein